MRRVSFAAIALALQLSVALILAPAAPAQQFSAYVWTEYQPVSRGSVPNSLLQLLESTVNDMLVDTNNDGSFDHLAPLVLTPGITQTYAYPQGQYGGSGRPVATPPQMWVDPGETVYTLSWAYPYLTGGTQNRVKRFLDREMANFRPLSFEAYGPASPIYQGVRRERSGLPGDLALNIWPPVTPAIETAYAYWLFARNTGDSAPVSQGWSDLTTIFDRYRNAYNSGRKPTYSEIGGLIGFARLAQQQGATSLSNDAAALASRIMQNEGLNFGAMQSNIDDDLNRTHHGWVTAVLANIQPEVGRYIHANVPAASAWVSDITSMRKIPLWYQAYAEGQGFPLQSGQSYTGPGFLGENSYYLPIVPYTIFLGRAYAQDAPQSELLEQIDVPWSIGDLYYIQKLLLTIEASGTPAPLATPSPSSGGSNPGSTPTRTATPVATQRTSTPTSSQPTATSTSMPSAATITVQAAQSSGDVNEDGSSFSPSASTLWLGSGSDASNSYLGLNFTAVNVPRGATIKSAHLEVYSPEDSYIRVDFVIAAEAIGNSPPFSSGSPPSQRVRTNQTVLHSSDTEWPGGVWTALDEMGPVVQEVISRSDWRPGNSLSVLLKGVGQTWARKYIQSFEGSPSQAPRLVITYQ